MCCSKLNVILSGLLYSIWKKRKFYHIIVKWYNISKIASAGRKYYNDTIKADAGYTIQMLAEPVLSVKNIAHHYCQMLKFALICGRLLFAETIHSFFHSFINRFGSSDDRWEDSLKTLEFITSGDNFGVLSFREIFRVGLGKAGMMLCCQVSLSLS